MRILLTNDDGIDAIGLKVLYRSLQSLGDIQVIAPADVQSATGHAITFHRPVQAEKRTVRDAQGRELFTGYAVHGRPADCVKLAVHHLLDDPSRVDLVVSGMNAGANVGVNVFYSGTVGAAREGAIWGLPSLAVSLHIGKMERTEFDRAADLARQVIDRVLAEPMAAHSLVNINLPVTEPGRSCRGIKVAPICTSRIIEQYEPLELQGRCHYQAAPIFDFHQRIPGSDVDVLFDGYVAVTPMSFDATCHGSLAGWRNRLAEGSLK